MALTIESGSIVSGADSFVTRAEFITYAANRGVTIADADATDAILRKAADYINNLEPRLKGTLTDRDQPMAFPRSGLIIEDWSWSSTEVPRQVIAAQLALGLAINAGDDPYNPPAADAPVTAKRVEGAVSVQYANPGQALKVSKDADWRTLVNLLLRNSGLMAVRS